MFIGGIAMPSQDAKPDLGSQLVQNATGLEDRLAELELELERAGRLATLGMMAGAVAHEFNNLLTPVLSYAQLALNDMDNRELVEKALTRCVEGAEKAATIAASMLGLVRPDGAEMRADVAAVIAQAVKSLSRDPAKDGIELVIGAPAGLVAGIRPVALEQIILNMVLNARSAIMPEPGTIRVTAERSTWNMASKKLTMAGADGHVPAFTARSKSAEGGEDESRGRGGDEPCILLRIMDTGRGIPPETAGRLFRPLETHSGTDAAGHTGTGLGLMICKRLIEEAGGAIGFKTAPGVGTSFTIVLPIAHS
ncbi:MAG: HAMP domain-containing histidine kinase [Phycisphaerales bacterium]|nr:HAMP domain-containing histidine kinase [Phycisphaerales bacterium]